MSKVADLAAGIIKTVQEIEKTLESERKLFAMCEERHRLMDIRFEQLNAREKGIENREGAQKQAMEQLSKVRTERRAALDRETKLAAANEQLQRDIVALKKQSSAQSGALANAG